MTVFSYLAQPLTLQRADADADADKYVHLDVKNHHGCARSLVVPTDKIAALQFWDRLTFGLFIGLDRRISGGLHVQIHQ